MSTYQSGGQDVGNSTISSLPSLTLSSSESSSNDSSSFSSKSSLPGLSSMETSESEAVSSEMYNIYNIQNIYLLSTVGERHNTFCIYSDTRKLFSSSDIYGRPRIMEELRIQFEKIIITGNCNQF